MKENFNLIKKKNNNNQVHMGENSIEENLDNLSSNKFTPRDKTNFNLKFEQLIFYIINQGRARIENYP